MKYMKYLIFTLAFILAGTALFAQPRCDEKGKRVDSGGTEINVYLKTNRGKSDYNWIKSCCEGWSVKPNASCSRNYISKFDGNYLIMAAAEYDSYAGLRYFAKEKGLDVDQNFRYNWDKMTPLDIESETELGFAIKNNNFKMVAFLLGKEEGENGNKIRYSNPKRKNPRGRDALWIAKDQYNAKKIDKKILDMVQEVYNTPGLPDVPLYDGKWEKDDFGLFLPLKNDLIRSLQPGGALTFDRALALFPSTRGWVPSKVWKKDAKMPS